MAGGFLLEKLFFGFGFLIASCIALYGKVPLSSIQIFGLSISAFLMSFSGIFDSPIEDERKITLSKIIKITSYGIAIIVIAILPTLENNTELLDFRKNIPDSVFLLSALGFAFITMYLGDIYKRKFRLQLRRAKLDGKKEVLEEIKNRKDKKKNT